MEFWLRIALATLSAPHQRCQHRIRGALLLMEDLDSRRTNDSSSASSSRNLRPFARSILRNLLGITNLQSLSPNKLDMPIYLIDQMAFLHLTSITLYVTAPSCVPASSSALPWALHSNFHPRTLLHKNSHMNTNRFWHVCKQGKGYFIDQLQ